MIEFWKKSFIEKQTMWEFEPSDSARWYRENQV